MDTVLTIDGTDYDDDARAANRITIPAYKVSLDEYDELSFVEDGCGPIPTFREVMAVELTIDGTLRFKGEIASIGRLQAPTGWQFTYRTFGLARLADFVPVRSRDGAGEFCANMPPSLNDPAYVASLTGLTVGAIVAKVLTVPATAAALDGYGVGGFDMTDPDVPALPTATTDDLAGLDVVPPQGVVLSGHGVINQLKDFIGQWHRSKYLYVRPDDGVIRVFDVNDLPTAHALVVPGDTGFETADPVEWPSYTRDVTGCYSRVEVVGRDIQIVALSTKDGTLTDVQGTNAAWTSTEEAAWRITDFAQPKDARDRGAASSVTLTSCVVDPESATTAWPLNFWNDRQATIVLYDDSAPGIEKSEERPITSCTALTAGGTATIGWDASIPLQTTTYTRYRIWGKAGALARVGRVFQVRDPVTGDTGLDTEIGAHLVTAFPRTVNWTVGASVTGYSMPTGAVFWSIDGTANGFNEITIPIQVDPEAGEVTTSIPIVQVTASLPQLQQGYPTTYAAGKPTDFVCLVAYNRGELVAASPDEPVAAGPPATGHSGGAYDQLGLERTLFIPVESWTWIGDRPAMLQLAASVHESVREPIDEGSIFHHGMPSWDCLTLGYALNLSLSGGAESPWDGLDLAVRSATLKWHNEPGSPDLHSVEIEFSNRCRAFEGQSLYVHPQYSGQGPDYGGGDDFLLGAGVALPPDPSSFGPGVAMALPVDDGTSAAIQSYLGGVGEAMGSHFDALGGAMAAPGEAFDAFQGAMGGAMDDAMAIPTQAEPFRPSSRPKATFWEPVAVTDTPAEFVGPPEPPAPTTTLSQRRGFVPPAPEPPPTPPVADTRPLSERRGVDPDDPYGIGG